MRTLAIVLETGAKAVGYLLGSLAIVLAGLLLLTRTTLEEAVTWSFEVNGIAFTALLVGLTLAAVYCWLRLRGRPRNDPAAPKWLAAGLQAANGISTVALTFTLLGVTLGLSDLSGRVLTAETMPGVIHELTGTFALAFLTTVIGQPVAALLRTLLLVSDAINQGREETPAPIVWPELGAEPASPIEPIPWPLAEPAAPKPKPAPESALTESSPKHEDTDAEAVKPAPEPTSEPTSEPTPEPPTKASPTPASPTAASPIAASPIAANPTAASPTPISPKPAPPPPTPPLQAPTLPAPPLPAMDYGGERA